MLTDASAYERVKSAMTFPITMKSGPVLCCALATSATLDGNTLDGNRTCAPAPLCLRFLELLDDLVFAICGGRNAGVACSSGEEVIGIGSTFSSSSKSVEFGEIVR